MYFKKILILMIIFMSFNALAERVSQCECSQNIENFSEQLAYISPYANQEKLDQIMEQDIQKHLIK